MNVGMDTTTSLLREGKLILCNQKLTTENQRHVSDLKFEKEHDICKSFLWINWILVDT